MDIQKLFKNEYLYSLFTRGISITLAFMQSVIIARYLGSALKGTSAYIQSITSIGSIVVTFGMHQAYPYFRKKYGKEKIYNDYLSIITILYSVYLLMGLILALFFFKAVELKISAMLIPFLGYSNVMSYVCLVETPNRRNRWWSIIGFINVSFITMLWLCTKANIAFVIVILLFEDLLKCFVYTLIIKPSIRFHKGLIPLAIELFKVGFLPMVALLMTTLNYKIDVLMLRSFEQITTAQIGVYSVGMTLADKIALIPDTLKGVLVSKLSKGADHFEVAKVSRLCFWATVLCCMVILALGNTFINLLYGKEYDGAYQVLLICSFGTIFIGYFKLIAQYNIVNKKQIRNVALLSISVLINIGLNYLLIPRYELNGAAFASGVGYFLSGIIFVVWFAKSHGIPVSKMFLIQSEDFAVINKIIGRKKYDN